MANLITRADIITICGMNSGVEDRKIAQWITEAHIRFRKHLGVALYAALQASPSETRFVNLMADERGYGKSFLCWLAFSLAYPSLYAEADRAGVFIKKGDQFDSVGERTLSKLVTTAEDAAKVRQGFLLDYLKDNKSTYPELDTITGSEDRIDSTNTESRAGVSMRKANSQRNYRG